MARDLIKKGEIDRLKEAIEQSTQEGGQTLDQALYDLYTQGRISTEQALANADSANNLRIRIKNFDLSRQSLDFSRRDTRKGDVTDGSGPSDPRTGSSRPSSPLRRL